ncbi:MAG: hypothetical protein KDI66_17070 [Xanthomonadales bacterium]|nr:hypothetical protein [Xanthomonadales bacterium]
MNTNSKNARRHAIALALMTLAVSSAANAGQEWCLSRGEGEGLHYRSAETLTDIKDWVSQGAVLIFQGNNHPECAMLGAACNVSPGDVVTVSQNKQGELILHRSRPTGRPVVRDVARMEMDPAGRFLSGYSQSNDNPYGQQVFLYYTGTRHCTDSGFDYPADAQCRYFQLEVFPTGIDQDHRPDATQARWQFNQCPVASQQPGDGAGQEPPLP